MLNEYLLNSAIVHCVLIVVTLCAITDIREHRIPNSVLLPALVLAIVLNSLLGGFLGLVDCVLGLALGMAMLFPLYSLGGTSPGDVKLLGVVGALLGVQGSLTASVATLCFGGALGIIFVAWRLIEPILNAYIAQFVDPHGSRARLVLQTARVESEWKAVFPYAPAIACGSYFALGHLGYFSPMFG